MRRRYFFFLIFGFLLSGLFWWARNPMKFEEEQPGAGHFLQAGSAMSLPVELQRRRDLVEVLDQLVALESYHRSV